MNFGSSLPLNAVSIKVCRPSDFRLNKFDLCYAHFDCRIEVICQEKHGDSCTFGGFCHSLFSHGYGVACLFDGVPCFHMATE